VRTIPSLALAVLLASACGCTRHDPPPTTTGPSAKPASAESKKKNPEPTASKPKARYFVGGDSKEDKAHVLPWAFGTAKDAHADAFLFLGDMENTGGADAHFEKQLAALGDVPFYPAIGNHELAHGKKKKASEAAYQKRFLDTTRTPVKSAFEDKVVYSVDLPGGVHWIALDNVSQKGFGDDQLEWLAKDLGKAKGAASTKHLVVGMHKPLADNGVTKHSMDEDGAAAAKDSKQALALFQKSGVELVLASHLHEYVKLELGGIASYISGGLGAPLVSQFTDKDPAERRIHHVLRLDVFDDRIDVTMLKFPGAADTTDDGDEEDEAP
jgi:hypothetical protein